MDWQQKSYSVAAGTHTLKWRYIKNGSVSSGENRAWVDFVQWSGPSPAQDPSNWQEIAYKHDVLGRRVEKKVDGYSTRYVYDGGHVIAEYDGNNNLLRKYIYGPGIDQPVCMIEVADANAVYYYHFDALGSVVALSNAAGDTVQTYEYSVYGEVAVEDANHPNPYMFAGVRYDIEIGLYYNRARYYNPFTGRFLQTDPIGYGDGMNWYAYCRNNPVGLVDPAGSWASYSFNWVAIADTDVWVLQVLCWDDPEQKHLGTDFYFTDWEDMWTYVKNGGDFCDVSFNFQSWSIYAMNGEQSDSGHPDTPPGSGSGWGTAALAGGICLVIPGPFDEAALGGILLGKAAVAAAKTAAEAAAIVAAGVAADMVLEHWARTRPGSTMGTTGPPNGVSVEDRGGGHGTIREYGPDGRAARDYDLGHDHGSGDPHVHDWDWSKPIPRGDGRSLRPGE